MTILTLLASFCWFAFIVVWFITALRSKRTTKRPLSHWIFRLAVFIIVLIAIKEGWIKGGVAWWTPSLSIMLQAIGVAITALGTGIAFWARFYLGTNWGMPMSLKENPELVTGGPYAYIRNPIYTGVLLAMFGSGWALGSWWFLVLVFSAAYFIYAAVQEEKIMAAAFPDTYPAYKARTKMLIPFVF